ncbi:amino acid ABC transporter ATP-binding protein, PAAT family [Oceanospirillum multiglobuliferum]|uniref:Histidine/lysine/arginine/ornithine ABC transporter ATP-binding protein n=1 Tax=Oceanospirillum multiglobuliferum TaxID=64969 RepID=A0A1T4PBM3_9GAMM|nr:ATP-binding cassette domain-containing protein [Oceanospirillum multiglobuliferum]OPX55616.1 histidine/lysine/arginine/ornithine ABC transporter ATP-binding protein [Oceanospirillum multiglobuliferum]SJZ88953.1 amino acid ABC transporter ATP-binding protein, PAAT family [Oceanospirillum multiglobuliferum]
MPENSVICLKNIHKSFGDLKVLKGIDLQAHEHDVISIIGSSGSGKSTFLRCINLLETPTEGEIWITGEKLKLARNKKGDLDASDPRQLAAMRARVGFVFQNFNLWPHKTLLENIIEGPTQVLGKSKDEAIAYAEQLLRRVGLEERKDFYPSQISGGQQQRVAITRTLAMDPQLILFDEPTSALDPELVGEVLGVMRDLAGEGRTMLIVTHEMQFAREVSNKVMFLHQGQVEEFGHPDQVFGNPTSERCREFISSVY